ncbi:MAG: hypothetical protein ABWZ80_04625 [Beijerinckiaceae bacterium]
MSALKTRSELSNAVRKAADGSLRQAPLGKIGLLSQASVRIEPYATPRTTVSPK